MKVLRFLKSNLDSVEKDKLSPLSEEEATKVLKKRVKQSNDSIEQYRQGGRADLVKAEQAELDMILAYLPPQLAEAELESLIRKVVEENHAAGPKDFGLVMKKSVEAVAGRADGKAVKQTVDKILSER